MKPADYLSNIVRGALGVPPSEPKAEEDNMPIFYVYVEDKTLYRVKVKAASAEAARVLLEIGGKGIDEEISSQDVTIGEVQDAKGNTLWERP